MRGYRADTAFDGEHAIPGGALVLVEGSQIIGVEAGSASAPSGCEVTHLPGTTLLPGLIDTHVHLCGDGSPKALDQFPELSADELDGIISTALQIQLAAGVTSVRDLGDYQWAVVERRLRGSDEGPTIVASGPPITIEQGHCWSMGGAASGVEDLRQAVRERAARGADIVKIMTSGGAMTLGTDVLACQFTLEELRAVVEEAHTVGLAVTAHAHALAAVEQCVTAGVDGIEHCSCLTPTGMEIPPELAERLAAAGTLVCPTLGNALGTEPPPRVKVILERLGLTLEHRLAHVGSLYRAGVTLISGADSGISPGKPHGTLAEAVIELPACGVPTDTALASATSLAAKACGLADRTGRLQAGLDADLLLVDGNPLREITALRNVRTVVSRGRKVSLPAKAGCRLLNHPLLCCR
ncbi:MAG: amidohydrolase family protein [Actinomycetota bacterium]|nr:amidohydrolase family protein [Actinomycetota bacterium]